MRQFISARRKNQQWSIHNLGKICLEDNLDNEYDWLECNGQAVSRNEYPTLFQLMGTTFGHGDSVSTFNLPDLR